MRPGILVFAALLIANGTHHSQAQAPPLPAPATDPSEFGSLRLDPLESIAPAPGEWQVLVAASYFNQWNGTWHTRRAHEGFGRARQPIGDDEIAALERDFPADDIYRFDIEGSRFDVVLARGLRRGISVQARIPWIVIGDPAWDSLAETVHDTIPADDHYARELFARNQTFLYLRAQGRSVLRRDEIRTSGVGDIALSVAVPLRTSEVTAQRAALTIEFPTGEKGTLHGSGGYDLGVRWFLTRRGRRSDQLFGLGYTRQDRAGSFLGFGRSDTFHAMADYSFRITERTAVHFGGRLDSSPLDEITHMNVGDPTIFYRLGLQRQVGAGQFVSFEIGEEIAPQIGVDADFSFHLSWAALGNRSPQ